MRLNAKMKNKAVFLDRDGTMAKDANYCSRKEDFELFPTVPQAMKLLSEDGFKVIVVTNQSGIARGYFTEETLSQIHEKMKSELAKVGVYLDGIYYCPHHPDDNCECRKPRTALFLRAVKDFDIDLGKSFVVGDMPTDIKAGKLLGCKTVLISDSNEKGSIGCSPDCISKTLFSAVRWIRGVAWLERSTQG